MKVVLRGEGISDRALSVNILPRTDTIEAGYYIPRDVIVEYKDGRKEWCLGWECVVEVDHEN